MFEIILVLSGRCHLATLVPVLNILFATSEGGHFVHDDLLTVGVILYFVVLEKQQLQNFEKGTYRFQLENCLRLSFKPGAPAPSLSVTVVTR